MMTILMTMKGCYACSKCILYETCAYSKYCIPTFINVDYIWRFTRDKLVCNS